MIQTLFTSKEHPPNWNEINRFMPDYAKHGVYVWGSIVYNPKGFNIDPSLAKRCEQISAMQYEYGGDKFLYKIMPKKRIQDWWSRYLRDKAFWLAMELPACQKQYWEIENVIKNKAKLEKFAELLAKDLAKEGLISLGQAIKAITSKSLIKFKI